MKRLLSTVRESNVNLKAPPSVPPYRRDFTLWIDLLLGGGANVSILEKIIQAYSANAALNLL